MVRQGMLVSMQINHTQRLAIMLAGDTHPPAAGVSAYCVSMSVYICPYLSVSVRVCPVE